MFYFIWVQNTSDSIFLYIRSTNISRGFYQDIEAMRTCLKWKRLGAVWLFCVNGQWTINVNGERGCAMDTLEKEAHNNSKFWSFMQDEQESTVPPRVKTQNSKTGHGFLEKRHPHPVVRKFLSRHAMIRFTHNSKYLHGPWWRSS